MKVTRSFLFLTCLTPGFAQAQIPSYCPDASAFVVTPTVNSVSVTAPTAAGWYPFFSNPAVVTGNTVTLRLLSLSTTQPPVVPPAIVTGLAPGTYTLIIERYYSPPLQLPPQLACSPLTTSTTFVVGGAAATAAPVPGLSTNALLVLLGALGGFGAWSHRLRLRRKNS